MWNRVGSDRSDGSDESDKRQEPVYLVRLVLFRLLANDFFGVFVFAKAEERRLAEVIVACPFGEANLANEFGLQPDATPHLRG